jgi:putative NIF3 family GTP cyclohydrolase 1 type 2
VTDLAGLVARNLLISHLRVVAHGNGFVERVFLASGSGMSHLPEAVRHGADVMITGDVRYHAAKEAMELGIPVIDAGHYGLEKFAAELLKGAFQAQFRNLGLSVDCVACDVEEEPFLNIYHREEDFTVERAITAS